MNIPLYRKGRLFGHPVHLMLIHFPTALVPAAFLFYLISYFKKDILFASAAFYCITLGLVVGLLAAVFGAMDYFRIPSENSGWKKASWHAVLNVTWMMIIGVILGLQLQNYPVIPVPSLGIVVAALVPTLGMLISNYLGGELLFRHKIGTIEEEN